jgi:hypothetical protein
MWGVESSAFDGQTNINLCYYFIGSNVFGAQMFLDYLSANITYANEGFFGTNYFGYDATGKFVISDTGTNRYPLVELDALNGQTDTWNTASTDASAATGNVAVLQGDFIAHTNNESADILHFTAAEKAIATNQSPYQAFSATVEAVDGTATVSHASGSLVRIYCTNDTTLAFDSTGYPTSGVSRVAVELWAGTNSIGFASASITNAVAPPISSNDWTSLFFRRSGTNLWTGRY